jgi:hypothetical protein
MARIKFSVFVVASAVLAVVGMALLSNRIETLSKVQTAERLSWGQLLFETSGRLSQSYRTAALAVAAADPALLQGTATQSGAAPNAAVAATAGKAIRTAFERLPPGLRNGSVYLLGNERGVAVAPWAGGEPAIKEEKNTFGLAAASVAGPQGTHVVVEGKIYRVAAAPIRVLEAGGERTVGWLGAAFALDDAFAADQAKDLTMGVTLTAADAVASSLPAADRKKAVAAKNGPVTLGSFASLGPIKLPLFVEKPAPVQARSFPLEGIAGSQVIITAECAALTTLADWQRSALLGLGAILAAAVTVLVLLGAGTRAQSESGRRPNREAQAKLGAAPFSAQEQNTPKQEPAIVPPLPEPPAVGPDDFPFGSAKADSEPPHLPSEPRPASLFEPTPAIEPGPQAAPPPPEPPPFPSFSSSAEQNVVDRPFDPFASAPAVPEREPPSAVPVPKRPVVPPPPLASAAASSEVGSEEAHFQDVFNQFVSTRVQCNEPADGLTFEKFAVKLRKNRDQLIQKYNCKSVRFQVYVKDGKAALKATPLKE